MQIELTLAQFFVLLFAVALVLLFFVWIFVRMSRRNKTGRDLIGYSREQVQSRFAEIEKLLTKENDSSYKLAVIEADKLLDHVLKALGFPGADMGQRLRAASYKHEYLREVWFAHKMRNQLVHDANFHLTYWQAQDALKVFRNALKRLGVL